MNDIVDQIMTTKDSTNMGLHVGLEKYLKKQLTFELVFPSLLRYLADSW